MLHTLILHFVHTYLDVDEIYLPLIPTGDIETDYVQLPEVDDGVTDPIAISVPFPFGNSTQTTLYVCYTSQSLIFYDVMLPLPV